MRDRKIFEIFCGMRQIQKRYEISGPELMLAGAREVVEFFEGEILKEKNKREDRQARRAARKTLRQEKNLKERIKQAGEAELLRQRVGNGN